MALPDLLITDRPISDLLISRPEAHLSPALHPAPGSPRGPAPAGSFVTPPATQATPTAPATQATPTALNLPGAVATPAATPPRGRPTGQWVRCGATSCGAHLHVSELVESLNVCPRCGQHFRLSAPARIAQLADEGSFEEHGADWGPVDPLHFVSAGLSYHEKVGLTQRATGLPEAIVCGSASIGGRPVEMAVMDFRFLGGSMGTVVGEKLVRTLDRAAGRRRPVVVVSCSGGARMHEGLLSLMQMARTAAAVARLHQAGLPLLSVLTDPTTGGVAASFAGLGDVLIAEPGALIGFAGPRVVEQVTHQKLPPGAQRAEFLLSRGLLDMVIPRRQLRSCLVTLLRLYTGPGRTNHAMD